MSWARVDDKLHMHPKAEKAGLESIGLWAVALSYCADMLTDGFVSDERCTKLVGDRKAAARLAVRLTSSGLWHRADEPCPSGHQECDKYRQTEPGYRFHDWDDYQPSREDVLAEKARKKANLRAHRDRMRSRKETAPETGGETGFMPVAKPGRNSGPSPSPIPEEITTRSSLQWTTAGAPPASTTAAASTAMTGRQQAILAELRAHKALAGIADRALAETLDGRAISNGKPLELVFRAIRDAAADVQPGTKLEEVRKKVRTYADNAKPPRAGTRARPVQPMTRPEDCVPPADPNDPAHTFDEPMEPLL